MGDFDENAKNNNTHDNFNWIEILNNLRIAIASIAKTYETLENEEKKQIRNFTSRINIIKYKIHRSEITYEDVIKLNSFFTNLNSFLTNFKKNIEEKLILKNEIISSLEEVMPLLLEISSFLNSKISRSKVLNSTNFYEKQVKKRKTEVIEIEKKIKQYIQEKKTATIDDEKNNIINEIKKLTDRKEVLNSQIEKFSSRIEKTKEQKDVVKEWKDKIENVFSQLEGQIKPIRDEHDKLKFLFIIYCFFSIITSILLVSYLAQSFNKVHEIGYLLEIDQYLGIVFPLPILLSFLWILIKQLNRAQNQMVVLSKHIHEVKYTEGLLLAINNLTIDVNDSANRINGAIDKLLEKHLADNAHNMGWEKHMKEDLTDFSSKDISRLVKLLKMIRKLKF